MFVIVAQDSDGRVVDTYISDAVANGTIARPLKFHFVPDHVEPFKASAYETVEEASADVGKAVEQWGSEEYARYVGAVSSAGIMSLDQQGHAGGYVIEGTSDEEVAGRWYLTYQMAFKDWIALLRKKVKHRGETPVITWSKGGLL